MAISAPAWNKKPPQTYSLDSKIPFSLQNAVRKAAWKALNKQGIWGQSNWNNFYDLNESVLLMKSMEEDFPIFQDKFNRLRPNILLIGAFALTFPGAIEIAQYAKSILGNKVLVIIGGKHINETLFSKHGNVYILNSSPLRLMMNNKIPNVIDFVISGDGEDIITKIGYNYSADRKILISKLKDNQDNIEGNWVVGWNSNDEIDYLVGKKPLIQKEIPSALEVFGVPDSQNVFFGEADFTAHMYSYLSQGCINSCFFCSEKKEINNSYLERDNAPYTLLNQLRYINQLSNQYHKVGNGFIEDSMLLLNDIRLINIFVDLLEKERNKVKFGCQFTLESFQNPIIFDSIKRMTKFGLEYVFVGMETSSSKIAYEIEKNRRLLKKVWITYWDETFKKIKDINLSVGLSLMWGLGENQQDREEMITYIAKWQNLYKNPIVTSFNLATVHPLRNITNDNNYHSWNPMNQDYFEIFSRLFGEASIEHRYTYANSPTLDELKLLQKKISNIINGRKNKVLYGFMNEENYDFNMQTTINHINSNKKNFAYI